MNITSSTPLTGILMPSCPWKSLTLYLKMWNETTTNQCRAIQYKTSTKTSLVLFSLSADSQAGPPGLIWISTGRSHKELGTILVVRSTGDTLPG